MGVIDTVRSWFATEERATLPPPAPWVDNYWPYASIDGRAYGIGPLLNQTLQGRVEPVATDFAGLAAAHRANAVVWACMQARSGLFSEARFQFRQLRSGRPGDLFGSPALRLLETPWENGTTGDLLARMLQHADLGGHGFVVRQPSRLWMPRPDWVAIVHGSYTDPDMSMWDPQAELLGYLYWPGGPSSGAQPVVFQPREVAHFAPTPDPTAPARGLSWLAALAREVAADNAMTEHKAAYIANGATPNLVVTGVPGAPDPKKFSEWVEKFGKNHDGLKNAYRTMYLTGTADAKVLGNDLAQADFKVVQGAGETRIAAAAGVPAVVAGISEGLAGSSLNAGNFAASMRRFADITMRPLWRNAAGSLASIIDVPAGSELWYDDRDIAALKDDVSDAAAVMAQNASAIRQYIDAGFEPDAAVDAVNAGDLKRLMGKHSGLYSVQLQPPMPEGPEPEAEPDSEDAPDTEDKPAPAAKAGRGASVGPFDQRDYIQGPDGKMQGSTPGGAKSSGAALTGDEEQAVGRWARTSGPIQAAATGHGGSDEAFADIERLDSALAKSPLESEETFVRGLGADMTWDASMSATDPEGTVWPNQGGYRGSGMFADATGATREEAFDNIGEATVGKTFYHPGYLATSTGTRPPPEFDDAVHPVVMRVTAPAGTPAYRMSGITDSPHAEREVLLGRGRTLRVTGARQVTRTDSWTRKDYKGWELDVEVINP